MIHPQLIRGEENKHKLKTSFELFISFNYLKIIAKGFPLIYRKGNTINRQVKTVPLGVLGKQSKAMSAVLFNRHHLHNELAPYNQLAVLKASF